MKSHRDVLNATTKDTNCQPSPETKLQTQTNFVHSYILKLLRRGVLSQSVKMGVAAEVHMIMSILFYCYMQKIRYIL